MDRVGANGSGTMKTGRNDPCHCGSGQKYKKCCATKDDAARSAEAAAQAVARAAAAEAAEETAAQANPSGSAKEAGGRSSSGSAASKAPKGAQPRAPTVVRKHAV